MKNINWEKVGIYIALLTAFVISMHTLMDLKERIAKIEVKVNYIEERRK